MRLAPTDMIGALESNAKEGVSESKPLSKAGKVASR